MTEEPLAIYRRPGRYIVKQFNRDESGLWSILGMEYTREKAQALADALTLELKGTRRGRSQAR